MASKIDRINDREIDPKSGIIDQLVIFLVVLLLTPYFLFMYLYKNINSLIKKCVE